MATMRKGLWAPGLLLATGVSSGIALAQAEDPQAVGLDAVTVTGTRIKGAEAAEKSPVLTLSRENLENSGITSIGDILSRLPGSGSSLNTRFNSSGNFGFPPDGGGVGAGSATLSLRNLGAKRVLILIDGLRMVNESSASGVSAAVDLNTLPFSMIDRIEILTDGASSLYGSDAIAGVVNIITKKDQSDIALNLYAGDHSVGDGATQTLSLSFGDAGRNHRWFVDLSHYNQELISSNDFEQSRFPRPGTGVALGSSATPLTRSVFFNDDEAEGLCPQVDTTGDGMPDRPFCNITALGVAAGPGFVQDFPDGFKPFTNDDRFNFAPFNLLLTPSERSGVFVQGQQDFSNGIQAYGRVLYNHRRSQNRAAPEPIFLGPGAGTGGLQDSVSIDASNPFNPFGITLDANDNLVLIGRRPLEGGPRLFTQKVDTRYVAAGLTGDLDLFGRGLLWDVNLVDGQNRAEQTLVGTYNIANIARAVGPVADCTDPCVPLNLFGGPGTITPEMLGFIGYVEVARSEQRLSAVSANLSGGVFSLATGEIGAALGYEFREQSGFYRPDDVVTRGESNGVASQPTRGRFNVHEAYLEVDVPLLQDRAFARALNLSLATRYSDYSTFGSTTNSKVGLRWELSDELTARSTFAEGFRAPSIGELFGSPARFDAQISDPCSNAEDAQTQANCAELGVPPNFEQANTQISVRTGGNDALQPETSDSVTAGLVYSPDWAVGLRFSERLDIELTYYAHRIRGAVQAVNAQTQLDRCVATLDEAFCNGISRGPTGDINGFDNTLQNLGRINTDGLDLGFDWRGPMLLGGRLGARWQSTYLIDYEAISLATGLREPQRVGREVNDSGIPRLRSTLNLGWQRGDVLTGLTARYLSSLTEACQDTAAFPVCDDPVNDRNRLPSTTYYDLRLTWRTPMARVLAITAGVNNLLDKDPPVCLSCSLNGYDPSLYDLPGRFAYLQTELRF
jgi:iron complex outermembrane recepter protein